MGRRLLAWGACTSLLAIVGCTFVDGLNRDYQEVDCFPVGSCDGAVGDGSVTPDGDATTGPEAAADGTTHDGPGDGDAGPIGDGGGGDADTGGNVGSDASDGGMCPGSDLVCDGGCVADDPTNCGTCGHDCTNLPHVSGAVTCGSGGVCSFPLSSCAVGWTHCSANPDQGCETNVTSTSNCGTCGNACTGTTPVCTASGSTYQCASGCPAGTPTLCSGSCVDTTSNAGNCKTCGNVCTTSVAHAQATCVASACSVACNTGYSPCGVACVDETSDNNNCGACGSPCTGGKQCVSSVCQCPVGTESCGGSCVTDGVAACGPTCTVCTAPTNGTATCNGTTCGFTCNNPYTACNGACVNEAADDNNCGGCGSGFACPSGATCTSGVCQCPASELECGGVCAACTTPQNGSPVCSGSACSYTCNGGYTSCAGGCWNTTDDTQHCGSSCSPCAALDGCHTAGVCSGSACSNPVDPDGTPCGTSETCQGGVCSCLSGYTDCPSGCTIVTTDTNNCGTCGHVCPTVTAPSSMACSGGFCLGEIGGYQNAAGSDPSVNAATTYFVEVSWATTATVKSFTIGWTGGEITSTNFNMGLYTSVSGAPSSRVLAGTTAVSATGVVTLNVSETSVPAGTYWIAFNASFAAGVPNNVQLSESETCLEAPLAYSSSGLPATAPSTSGSCPGDIGLYLDAYF